MKIKILIAILVVLLVQYFGFERADLTGEPSINQASGQTSIRLDVLRWQNRIILVFGNQDTNLEAVHKVFQTQQVNIDERDIKYFLIGKQTLGSGPETFTQQYIQELRRKYGIDQNRLTVILIGKDGGEKYRQPYLNLIEIYREIDTMPMRMREMAQPKEFLEKMMIDFNDPDKWGQWRVVNDGVMGGISQSDIIFSNKGTAIFRGTLSLENNGGFASTRTDPTAYHIGGYSGLVMRIKGDGQRYQVRLRIDDRFDGISYRHRFTTRSESWLTIRVPFRNFVPVFRGRILTDVPPVSPEQIQQIGFLIADKQAGKFRLEIKWIQAYRQMTPGLD
ncbi:MAG: DUF4174 domain-containing protein [Deltaproteobacteria bacterium]|jgi:NADH dehydrogenase [ubiquinone] 1 alpha subcomplex assembly factor 1|nr:DUF4174 domain-containing protein [Deltaproteobacteria bacterium]